MNFAGHRFSIRHLLKATATLVLVFLMPLAVLGVLSAEHCDQACENQCGDDCQDCGNCIYCIPTVHMVPSTNFDFGQIDQNCGSTAHSLQLQRANILPVCIDHPPQNLH